MGNGKLMTIAVTGAAFMVGLRMFGMFAQILMPKKAVS